MQWNGMDCKSIVVVVINNIIILLLLVLIIIIISENQSLQSDWNELAEERIIRTVSVVRYCTARTVVE